MFEIPIKKSFCFLAGIIFLFNSCANAQQVVEINPKFPQRNDKVTITYNPKAIGALISDTAKNVIIKFTYSNLYEIPYEVPMKKVGDVWKKTIPLARYATFATFIIKSGEVVDQPAVDKQYELYVYQGDKPVISTYLYRGYSLSAQVPKSDSLAYLQSKQYEKEIELYPDNYEAQIALLSFKMNHGSVSKREMAKKQALQIIDEKFHSNPTLSGNVNQVTMGYLILGEKSRVDSVHEVVLRDYPNSDLAIRYKASIAAKEPDLEKRFGLLKALLTRKNETNENGYSQVYKLLFDYYAKMKDKDQAMIYANQVAQDSSPYRAQTLAEIAQELSDNSIALEQALKYSKDALSLVDEYPIGIIRYFPETGYIPGYVANRAEKIEAIKGDLKALEGTILFQMGRTSEAKLAMKEASEKAKKKETLLKIARYYDQISAFDNALSSYSAIYLESPLDENLKGKLKGVFVKAKGSDSGLKSYLAKLDGEWQGKMKAELKGKMIKKNLPALTNVTDLDGKPIDIESLRGKILVIDLWATWCIPCLQSFPYIQKVYDRYKDNERVVFLILNTGSQNTLLDAKKWKSTTSYTFPVYHNSDPKMVSNFGVNLIPASFIVDENLDIRYQTVGFEGEIIEPKMNLMIEILLKE